MKSKLHALNNELSDPALKLSADELKLLDEAFTALTVGVATHANGIDLTSSHFILITKVAERWPPAVCFPSSCSLDVFFRF